jgi:electron transfer flavoprotein alpha subunit
MGKLCVYSEFSNGKIKSGTLELLSSAQTSGHDVSAILFGPGAKAAAAELAHYGAKDVYVCEAEELKEYHPESFTNTVSEILKTLAPQYVLASGSTSARDLFPRVAGRLGGGIVCDC